jgi:hypothetical protein
MLPTAPHDANSSRVRHGLSRTLEKSMEARIVRALVMMAPVVGLSLAYAPFDSNSSASAAGYRTTNFTVSAPTPQLAKEIGDTAEVWRKKLSIEWLGEEMPTWSKSCPIDAKVAPRLGAGGATSFVFDRGEVFGWRMNIQGSRERVLDSVLPHEITHTIFASYFRQPLPRWADEGACTTVEHRSEIAKQERMLIDFLKTGRGIPFGQMFAMKDYPQDVMPLYSQGHSTAQWLIERCGKQAFLEFLADGMRDENWQRAVQENYGDSDLYAMQESWLEWVRQGRPQLSPATAPGTQLASHTAPAAMHLASDADDAAQTIYRGQSPDDVTPVPETKVAPSTGGSVYAAAAARAKQLHASSAATTASRSVYDASRSGSVLRR